MAEAILNQPHFKSETVARQWLENVRWPDGAVCPHCGSISTDHYKLEGTSHRSGLYKCKDCREQFTVTVGTVFERSKIKLNVWLQAMHLMCASKKGISSKQLERMLGVTYQTAWFMSHRIREAMTAPGGMFGSGSAPIEADATYIGGKEHKHLRELDDTRNSIVHWAQALYFDRGEVSRVYRIKLIPPNWEDRRPNAPEMKLVNLEDFVVKAFFMFKVMRQFHVYLDGGGPHTLHDIFHQPLAYPPLETHPLYAIDEEC